MTQKDQRDRDRGAAIERVIIEVVRDALNAWLDPWECHSTRPGTPTIIFTGVNAMDQVTGKITGSQKEPRAVSYEFTVTRVDGTEDVITSTDGKATVDLDGPGDGKLVERQVNAAGAKSKPSPEVAFTVPDPFSFVVPAGSPSIEFEDPNAPGPGGNPVPNPPAGPVTAPVPG